MSKASNLITNRSANLPTDWKRQAVGVPAGSGLEKGFLRLLRSMFSSLPEPEREYRFHGTRKWRFDFAWPDAMLAVEIEGMAPDGGRHQRRGGFSKDAEKYREAAKLGWTVLRYTSDELKQRPMQCAEEVAIELDKRIRKSRP